MCWALKNSFKVDVNGSGHILKVGYGSHNANTWRKHGFEAVVVSLKEEVISVHKEVGIVPESSWKVFIFSVDDKS